MTSFQVFWGWRPRGWSSTFRDRRRLYAECAAKMPGVPVKVAESCRDRPEILSWSRTNAPLLAAQQTLLDSAARRMLELPCMRAC